ncbi:MAG: cobalamin biosynthesis protein [Nitratireductor sp.]|nr:cobalamin biosynthesis protein [Nitratireductor sp.]
MADETLLILLVALAADWKFGEPSWLWSRLPHPVVLFGRAIGWLDNNFNLESDDDGARYRKGAVGISALIITSVLAGLLLHGFFRPLGIIGMALEGFIVFALIAQKSLIDHVAAVADGLTNGGITGGRAAVAKIVGRDPETLDRSGVSRAAIESLAENYSDGVVAPAFWYAVFGLPGLIAYKMINTADSMIGYRNERYEHFGKVAAQIDDLANWLPARLTAGIVALAALIRRGVNSARKSIFTAVSDAGLHRSPNAGWPEAAVAGACNFALGGPRIYASGPVAQAYINASGKRDLDAGDIRAAISLINAACLVLAGLILLWWLVF